MRRDPAAAGRRLCFGGIGGSAAVAFLLSVDLDGYTGVPTGRRGTHDRPQRLGNTSLLADHAAHIVRVNVQIAE